MSQQQSDYDGAWKEALEHYLSEFVAFSEIEKFLDTPVKRYPST